jgi:transcriptional regulator with XRE-family HTH domain
MLIALGRVVREARLAAGLTQLDVATAAKTSHGSISRLERAASWPEDPDRIVSAYERECKLAEGELWKRAAQRL